MNTIPKLILLILISISFVQCVTKKKYNDLLDLNNYAAEELKNYNELKESEVKQRKELLHLI